MRAEAEAHRQRATARASGCRASAARPARRGCPRAREITHVRDGRLQQEADQPAPTAGRARGSAPRPGRPSAASDADEQRAGDEDQLDHHALQRQRGRQQVGILVRRIRGHSAREIEPSGGMNAPAARRAATSTPTGASRRARRRPAPPIAAACRPARAGRRLALPAAVDQPARAAASVSPSAGAERAGDGARRRVGAGVLAAEQDDRQPVDPDRQPRAGSRPAAARARAARAAPRAYRSRAAQVRPGSGRRSCRAARARRRAPPAPRSRTRGARRSRRRAPRRPRAPRRG